jgi:hypothetical protein
LRGDGRCIEDGIGFVDFKAVGVDILKVSKHERAWLRKKEKENTKMIVERPREVKLQERVVFKNEREWRMKGDDRGLVG